MLIDVLVHVHRIIKIYLTQDIQIATFGFPYCCCDPLLCALACEVFIKKNYYKLPY